MCDILHTAYFVQVHLIYTVIYIVEICVSQPVKHKCVYICSTFTQARKQLSSIKSIAKQEGREEGKQEAKKKRKKDGKR